MEASALQAPVAISRFSVSVPLLRLRSDEQLVALFRAGSDDAFRVIHDRYRARLLAYTRQMLGGSRADAEDALQDVFFRAYGSLRDSDRPVSLRAWLYRIAHNRCIDQLRRPTPAPGEVLEMSRPPAPDPAAETERREDLRRLVVDVGRLPAQQRSALLMRELQGCTYDEMSESLQVSVAAVKSLLVRARGGLIDAAEARETTCHWIRDDLALACDRGVRASGLARRHLRDCAGCREYRDDLRAVRRRVAALIPAGPLGPLGAIAKALGLGGSGAAAGGAATGGGAVALGGASAVATVAKVALVCAAAVTAGGALQAARHVVLPEAGHGSARSGHASAALPRSAAAASHAATAAGARVSTVAVGGARSTLRGGASVPATRRHPGGGFITGQDLILLPTPTGSATGDGAPLDTVSGVVNAAVSGSTVVGGGSSATTGSQSGASSTAGSDPAGSTLSDSGNSSSSASSTSSPAADGGPSTGTGSSSAGAGAPSSTASGESSGSSTSAGNSASRNGPASTATATSSPSTTSSWSGSWRGWRLGAARWGAARHRATRSATRPEARRQAAALAGTAAPGAPPA